MKPTRSCSGSYQQKKTTRKKKTCKNGMQDLTQLKQIICTEFKPRQYTKYSECEDRVYELKKCKDDKNFYTNSLK